MSEPGPADDDLTALLRRFELPLLQYATRILGDHERARDVVQETFVELQRQQRRQQDPAPAKWLFTVCRNRALNIFRKEKRMTYLDDEVLDREPGVGPAPNDASSGKKRAVSCLGSSRPCRRGNRKCCS